MNKIDNEQLLQKALQIIQEGSRRGILVRLLGGLAIYYHCPHSRESFFARTYGDIDLFGLSSQRRLINEVMEDLGYKPYKEFNAIHGERRLMYYDEHSNVRVDYLLDFFEMCHKIDIRNRLEEDEITIPLADLLLTKLQVIELTEKDVKDVVVLFIDHELGDSDEADKINAKYIAKLCSDDWGLYKTVNMTLDKVVDWINQSILDMEIKENILSKINRLRTIIDAEPKSLKWRMRAKIGEKIRWYEIPEEPLHKDFPIQQ
jgi:hypothetical protein